MPSLNGDSMSNDFKFELRFFSCAGTITLDDHALSVSITIAGGAGVTVRPLVGVLKDTPDVKLKIHLTSTDGEVRFYLEGTNELCVYLNITIPNGDVLEGHYKIPTP
jgi:hypothetical protein